MPISSSEDNPQRARRVLQVHGDALLDAGLSTMLQGVVGVEVWIVTYQDDASFRRDVEHVHPHVILLNQARLPNYDQVLKALTGVPAQPTVRIIVVSLDTNAVDVYDLRAWKEVARKRVVIGHPNDLAALIRDDEPA